MESESETVATTPVKPSAWDESGNPIQTSDTSVSAWDEKGNPVTASPSPVTPTPSQNPTEGIDPGKLGMSLINSRMLSVPESVGYQLHEMIHGQFKQRGTPLPDTSPGIASDIKSGLQGSIFGLAYRNKLPDAVKSPGTFDKIVTGLSQMVADLPFYAMGGVIGKAAGAAAGSEIPGVGNVIGGIAGGGIGQFAVPAAIRESLIEGIQKGDIKSFQDLVERSLNAAWSGAKEAPVGLATELSGGATIPLKFLGPASSSAETMMKIAQQGAAIETVSKLSEGKMPTADGFVVNTALMTLMHTAVGSIGKAAEVMPKAHDMVLNEYAKSGTHPATMAAEALWRAQQEPTENVIDRINQISRDTAAPEGASKETVKEPAKSSTKEEPIAPDLPPATLRPAVKDSEGNVHIGGEGETHADVVERTGEDAERGFVDRKGEFHTREEAKAVLHTEDPEVYQNWERESGGPDEEFHTSDYNEALRKSTGVKNAAVDVQRAQRGLQPLESGEPTRRADIYAQAKEDVDSGKVNPLQIAESINKSPRGISDSETDALNYFNTQLSNQHKAEMDAIDKAKAEDDPFAEANSRERLQDIEHKQDVVEQAVRKAGTQSGRAMRARQDMIKEDYSLDHVLQRARIASKSGEISPEVRDHLETLVRGFKEANDRLEAHIAKLDKADGQQAIERMKQEVARKERKTARKEERAALDDEFSGLIKDFDSLLMGRMSANPFFDPEVIGLLGKMARNRVESGLTRFEDVVDYVHGQLTDLGHEFSKRDIGDAISGYGKTSEMSKDAIDIAMREIKRQGKLISALEDAKEALRPMKSGLQRDKASERVSELTKQVKQAMRDSGIDTRPSLTPEQQWKSALDGVKTRLRNQITDLTKQLREGKQELAKKSPTKLDPEAQALKDLRDNLLIKQQQESTALQLKLREALNEVEGKAGVHPETKIKSAKAAIEKSIAEYERRIKENDLTQEQRKSGVPETPELNALRARRDELQKTYRELKQAAEPKKSPEQIALDRYKKQLTNRIDDMDRQLKTGDFSKEPRKPLVLDQQATDLKVDAERKRRKVDEAIAKQKRESRSTTEKVVDTATKWRRAALLTGFTTLGKLTNAAMQRMGVTPVEEILGGVLSKIPGISSISERAPMQGGGLDVSAEVKAVSQLWSKATAKDMWDELTKGHDSLDALFGGKAPLPSEVLGLFGQLHGALKVPEKRAEFFRRFEIGMEWAKKNNLDVNDPRVQSAVGLQSYLESQRAILMQDNSLTSAYQVMLSYLHNQGALGKTFEAGARFMFPMVRVATNLPGEALSYTPPALLVRGVEVIAKLANKDRMGKSAFDNISMHDMDNIMRGLKKGSVGLALSAIGFAFRKNITGYYLTEQEKKQGIKRGISKIGGVTIPAYLNDTPPLIAIQLAATVGRVWDHYNLKGHSGGLVAGTVQAAEELAKRVPFYGQLAQEAEATRTPEQSMVNAGELAGSVMVPALIRQIAEARDKAPYGSRKPQSFTDAIKLQIPGLRETVPQRGATRRAFKKQGR